MNRFAELLDRLTYEPARNAKLRLMTDYFRSTPDPERGWALAALTGGLSFPHAKPGLIRNLIAERTDPVLFELSYDYVGDLSETVALMWPVTPSPLVGEGWSGGSGGDARTSTLAHDLSTPTPNPSPQGGGEQIKSAASCGYRRTAADAANVYRRRTRPPRYPPPSILAAGIRCLCAIRRKTAATSSARRRTTSSFRRQ
jgi:DNA ligase-1